MIGKSRISYSILLSAVILLMSSFSVSALAVEINYQGYLTDTNGVPVDGTTNMTFRLYDVDTGGTSLWDSGAVAVDVANGVYSVILGDTSSGSTQPAIDPSTFANQLWLGVEVQTDGEMAPRQKFVSVSYSIRAETAENVPDGSITDEKITGPISGAKLGAHDHDEQYYNKAYIDSLQASIEARFSSLESTAYSSIPPPPYSLSVTPFSASALDLSWSYYPTSLEDFFKIERSDDGTSFFQVAVVPADSISYRDNSLSPLTTYYYRVRASNVNGDSSYSNTSSATTPAFPVPAAPTNLITTTISSTRIDLTWTDNADNETGFKIERGPDGVNFTQIDTTGADTESYSDNGLDAATTYYYRVSATNIGGDSGYSNISSATTLDPSVCDGTITVFYMDPAVSYNGIEIYAKILTLGPTLANPVNEVKLITFDQSSTNLSFVINPSDPEDITATIPAGLTAGNMSVEVKTLDGSCGNMIDGSVITDGLTLSLDSVSPDHVSSTVMTGIVISSTNPTPPSMTGFIPGARAYLSPAGGGKATRMSNETYEDPFTLRVNVPAGLTPGVYDLIVSNPDGTNGVVSSAITVLTSEPPVISGVAPDFIYVNSGGDISISGQNFIASPFPQVDLICKDSFGGMHQSAASVVSATTTSIDATAGPAFAPANSVCMLMVTNNDGGYGEFSSILAANSALNLGEWSSAGSMLEARRGHALVTAGSPSGGRFLYAIGGDDGSIANAKITVESSPLDRFGEPGVWSQQRNTLPVARTFGKAVTVDDFVYLSGGNDGATTSDKLLRAKVLGKSMTPTIVSASLYYDTVPAGLSGGQLYYYSVSAVFPPSDPDNPGGESLASDVVTVQVPSAVHDPYKPAVALQWSAVTGASAYRVYRASTPGSFELLVEIAAPTDTWNDDGGTTPDPGQTPLPAGSLGVWHDTLSSMNTAREGHALVVAPDPDTPGQNFLYAIGGIDGSGSYLNSLEYATVSDSGSISAWTGASEFLGVPRTHLVAWLVSNANIPIVNPGDYWIFVGPGYISPSMYTNDIEAFMVAADGSVPPLTVVTQQPSSQYGGYSGFTATGRVQMCGGRNGPATQCIASDVELPMPKLGSWNSEPSSLPDALEFMGYTQYGACNYITGGYNGTSAVNSVIKAVK